MENSAIAKENYLNGNHLHSFSSVSASIRHVSYSCGTCGYELNLSSSNRNTSTIGSKYGKSIKRGIISFFDIDESRFTQAEEFQCIPYFSKSSWGFFRRRTKLLCRKCGNYIGIAYEDETSAYPLVSDGSDSSSVNESKRRKYDIKIRALQPSSVDRCGTPLYM
ncbi:uncharacterized protein At4g08330, chloroplastic [Ricinus communis]|uniref:uncharacterized protein At4g08330, chloroplastic n=1 Tax=Ricinus communis TaxID=3988 RepID=UPI0007721AFD|nr:uncharacterized protein At4g08330, chloroplastic [Ricinus communis]|eukprot:XP_015571417.1 uncharacterized protein At4g08330, chloroplastic [Ricinus communis]